MPVVYLTGAPATGKSTLCRNLAANFPDLAVFSYSERLRDHVARRIASQLSEEQIRQQSGRLVTAQDVQEVDLSLLELLHRERGVRSILIDSHAVTKEVYGFRVTPFSDERVLQLDPDFVICLYADSEVIVERIRSHPMGRPAVTNFEADMHTLMQSTLALHYATRLGRPLYLLDSSVPPQELVKIVAERAQL